VNGNINWRRALRASSIQVTKRLYCLAARSGIWREYRADVSSQVDGKHARMRVTVLRQLQAYLPVVVIRPAPLQASFPVARLGICRAWHYRGFISDRVVVNSYCNY
jgi:hypothetical protein